MMRWIRGLLALVGLAAILVGLPALLIAIHDVGAPRFGWSLQGLLQAVLSPDDGTLALTLFKIAGWVSWAILTFAVGVELVARARRIPVPRIRGFALPQRLARTLVTAVVALFVAAGSMTTAAPSIAASPEAPAHIVAAPAALPHYTPQESPKPAEQVSKEKTPKPRTVKVKKGDTLSAIALEETGKASNYGKIAAASKKTEQPGGRHLKDPNLILPGWTVTIPPAIDKEKPEPAPAKKTPTKVEVEDHAAAEQTLTPATPAPQTSTPTPSASATVEAEPDGSQLESRADEADDLDASEAPPAWLLSGLSGAGSLLAGSLFLVLRRRRAAQFRSRRPGRTVTAPPPALAPVEKTLIHEGAPSGELVVFIDEVLRRLVSGFVTAGHPLPALVGVDVGTDHVTIRLRTPADMPTVWEPVDGDTHQVWRIDRDADLNLIGPLEADSPPPWPQLVTLGWDAHGWRLVNLEALGVVSITGDEVYAGDLARYLVAELAVSPWSRDVEVDCLAICEELPGLAPARVHFHTDPTVVVDRVATAVATVDRLDESSASSLETARATFAGDELWDSRVLVTSLLDVEHLDVLTRLVVEQPGSTATSVLLVDPSMTPAGVEMRLTDDGRIEVPLLGLNLIVNGLTRAEARGCVAVLAAGEDLSVVEIPVAADPAAEEWTTFCDEAGSLREELTVPRGSDVAGTTSLMPAPDEVYVATTANTVDDLAVLAPMVPVTVRDQVEAVDPTLDADLEAWWSSSCDRPRLQVLGPMKVRVGRGGEPTKAAARVQFYTEVVAFLSTRPGGATTQEVADALGISVARVRRDLSTVRGWLGVDPVTGEPFLPEAMKSQRAIERGVGLYLVEGLLSDADLFRRLRLRAEARGADGLDDLRLALRLVNGVPFDDMRAKGGVWLTESRLDQWLLCAIVDVAHMVSTIALEAGDIQQARAAAELAALAAPHEDTPGLDLAAIAAREGQPAKAAEIAREVMSWRDGSGDGPPDLGDRSETILRTHRWLEQASKAS